MDEIRLAVTQRALDQAERGPGDQRQMAICGGSPEVVSRIREANARQRVRVRLGGCVVLEVGDTHAIWRAHQGGPQKSRSRPHLRPLPFTVNCQLKTDNSPPAAYFDSLFEMLSRRPDVEMRFVAEVV